MVRSGSAWSWAARLSLVPVGGTAPEKRAWKAVEVIEREGRAPRPRGGDPNVKTVRLTLTPEEWRKLRLWAAEDDTSVQAVIGRIVRGELDRKPRHAG